MSEQNTLWSGVFGLRFSEVFYPTFGRRIYRFFPDVSRPIYNVIIFNFYWFSFYLQTSFFSKIDSDNGTNKRPIYDCRLYLQTLLICSVYLKRDLFIYSTQYIIHHFNLYLLNFDQFFLLMPDQMIQFFMKHSDFEF